MLRKGIYPDEDMDSWEKFDKTAIPSKEAFYGELNGEGISDADSAHVKKVWKVFEIKNWGEYHNYMFRVIHCCLWMCLKALKICVLKNMDLIPLIF